MDNLRNLIIITCLIGLAAGVAWAAEEEQAAENAEPSDRYKELVKEKGAFQETWVLPGASLKGVNKVYLWGAGFQYRDVGPAKRTRSTMSMSSSKNEFGISEEGRQWFEEVVGEAFDAEFSKAKNFEIVDEIGPDTIIIRGGLADIVSKVPPEFVGRSEIYLASVGAATLVLEVIDAETGTVLAAAAERRGIETLNARGGMGMVQTNRASIRGDVSRWTKNLARRLRDALDKAIKQDNKA
ncbi:MAG: hypothetical protein AAGE43_01770 [Pseudomonadota bacterium]